VERDIDSTDLIQTPPRTPSDGLGLWVKPIAQFVRRVSWNGKVIEEPDEDEPVISPKRNGSGARYRPGFG
jgi:hypothetical protein